MSGKEEGTGTELSTGDRVIILSLPACISGFSYLYAPAKHFQALSPYLIIFACTDDTFTLLVVLSCAQGMSRKHDQLDEHKGWSLVWDFDYVSLIGTKIPADHIPLMRCRRALARVLVDLFTPHWGCLLQLSNGIQGWFDFFQAVIEMRCILAFYKDTTIKEPVNSSPESKVGCSEVFVSTPPVSSTILSIRD